jgi:glycosyltransferase involved in cell wall biosynthesis
MKLLVNLSTLGAKPTGLGVYAAHCAQAVAEAFDAEFIAPASYSGPGRVTVRSPENITIGAGRTAAIRRWWWARRFTTPAGRLPYSPTHQAFPNAQGQVLTIHDLISLRFPDTYPVQASYFRQVIPRHLKRCRAVFTVSETTRQDVHDRYGFPLGAIHVVPNGVDPQAFRPPAQGAPREAFLLMVGASFSHKNVEELLDRGALWKSRYTLVIASCRGDYRRRLEAVVAERGLTERVRFLDYVTPTELVSLYQRCAAFVYPSRWEGFGIPPLEAMACGAPVIASDIPAHREVLGSAATLVRLGDTAAWEAALGSLDRPREPAATAGLPPHERYTWARSAEALVAALTAIEPTLAQHAPAASAPAPRIVRLEEKWS